MLATGNAPNASIVAIVLTGAMSPNGGETPPLLTWTSFTDENKPQICSEILTIQPIIESRQTR
jgi:hypothetical protein